MSIFRRKEFIRVAPEEVGVPSEAVNWLLDRLEEGWTEPHGLMLMRKGKIFAEGWWSPYAPGIRHGLQSHTKTYAATAVGIAYTEGLLSLAERMIDIFPDKAPEAPSAHLKTLKVRHVLSMGCGMDEMPRPGLDWITDFLATPVNHEPGTTYMYKQHRLNPIGGHSQGEKPVWSA
jgi:CubicO group peptidase (beta-lactamase class C family)